MREPKIGCLVMAAGNAARFRANKLAAEYGGKTLIRRALETVPKETLSAVTVVTQYPEVAELSEEFGFSHIKNEHPDYGISHTIALGTQAMRDCDAILYMVSDQPLLERSSVERVIACWKENPSYIVGAAHNGKRGNPCIFPREFFDELLALTEDHGGNTVIRAHPERLLTVEVGKAELTDVDTPEALEGLKSQA
ncbi:MAG: nucleotidyltransferase family protein [Oscillospiraceae bacterium]|nr:nucleotidyltransferase family protein [Oscillospiraceae bacterium]